MYLDRAIWVGLYKRAMADERERDAELQIMILKGSLLRPRRVERAAAHLSKARSEKGKRGE